MNLGMWWDQTKSVSWATQAALLIAILVGGWLLAWALASTTRALLKKTKLDATLASWLDSGKDGEGSRMAVEAWLTRTVYWGALLFVLVAFLQRLGLESVTVPINAFLTRVAAFMPQLLGAGLLMFMALLVARVSRALVARSVRLMKMGELEGPDGTLMQREALGNALGETAYWLSFLLFAPAVLGALGLEGLLAPVQHLLDRVLSALPHVASSALVLLVGWFLARAVQRIVSNMLRAAGSDGLGQRLGLGKVLGERSISDVVGIVAHALVLLPVVVASLNALGFDAITQPASRMLSTMLDAVPRVFGASVLLALSYVAARLAGGLVQNLLSGLGFDHVLERLELTRPAGEGESQDRVRPSAMAEKLTVVAIMLFALMEAARMIGFAGIAEIVLRLSVFGAHVLAGLALVAGGLYLGNLAARAIERSQAQQAKLLALLARMAILSLSGAMALEEVGLASRIIELAFGLVLGSVCAAFALAFGMGGREIAAREVDGWLSKLRDKPVQAPPQTFVMPSRSNPPPSA